MELHTMSKGAAALLLAAAAGFAQTVTISGTVMTMTGQPIAGATVKFKGLTNTATTDAAGKYTFVKSPTALRRAEGYRLSVAAEGGSLALRLDRSARVSLEILSLDGRSVRKLADRPLPEGSHAFDLGGLARAHQLYLVKVQVGEGRDAETGFHKLALQGAASTVTGFGERPLYPALAKPAAAAETLLVTHPDYHGGLAGLHSRGVTTFAGTHNFRMFSRDAGWNACAPPFTFNFDNSAGALYYKHLLPETEAANQEVLREVCQSIWAKPEDIPAAKRFKTYVADINATVTTGVAATGGNKLYVNVNYINSQKGQGDAKAWYEIVGVLIHEAVHSYQPYYGTAGADGFGEAVPDAIRALTGFFRWPAGTKCTGSYTDVYQTGGKYWYFIEQKHPGFINKIYKLTAGDISTRVQQVTGATLASLVSECQTKGMP